MNQQIHYTLRYDSKRKVWRMMGKVDANRGYCLEVDFLTQQEANLEIMYLEQPAKRPKK